MRSLIMSFAIFILLLPVTAFSRYETNRFIVNNSLHEWKIYAQGCSSNDENYVVFDTNNSLIPVCGKGRHLKGSPCVLQNNDATQVTYSLSHRECGALLFQNTNNKLKPIIVTFQHEGHNTLNMYSSKPQFINDTHGDIIISRDAH